MLMSFFNFSEKLIDSSIREKEEGGGEREGEKERAQEQECEPEKVGTMPLSQV